MSFYKIIYRYMIKKVNNESLNLCLDFTSLSHIALKQFQEHVCDFYTVCGFVSISPPLLAQLCALTAILKVASVKWPYHFLDLPHEFLTKFINVMVLIITLLMIIGSFFIHGNICLSSIAFAYITNLSRFDVRKVQIDNPNNSLVIVVYTNVLFMISLICTIYISTENRAILILKIRCKM